MRLPLSVISYGPLVTGWCLREYPRHPDGCQNYLKKDWCPPKAPMFPASLAIDNYYLISGRHNIFLEEISLLRLKPGKKPTMWLFVEHFDLGAFARALQEKNLSLSDAQARISYLWQDKVYRKVYARAQAFRWTLDRPTLLLERPEANGVNLFATCRVNGGPQLERNPQEDVYLMAILGVV